MQGGGIAGVRSREGVLRGERAFVTVALQCRQFGRHAHYSSGVHSVEDRRGGWSLVVAGRCHLHQNLALVHVVGEGIVPITGGGTAEDAAEALEPGGTMGRVVDLHLAVVGASADFQAVAASGNAAHVMLVHGLAVDISVVDAVLHHDFLPGVAGELAADAADGEVVVLGGGIQEPDLALVGAVAHRQAGGGMVDHCHDAAHAEFAVIAADHVRMVVAVRDGHLRRSGVQASEDASGREILV